MSGIGEIRLFAGEFAPRGWTQCDGSSRSTRDQSALFTVLGYDFGWTGSPDSFFLPRLTNAMVVGGPEPAQETFLEVAWRGQDKSDLSAFPLRHLIFEGRMGTFLRIDAHAGEVQFWPGKLRLPESWLPADGSTRKAADHPQLAQLLGPGSAGTFTLPDLHGRAPIGSGPGAASPTFKVHHQDRSHFRTVSLRPMICPADGDWIEDLLGEIRLFAHDRLPKGYLPCDGRKLPLKESHFPLFSILGTTYGGDGKTTFHLPDLRGPVPFGIDDRSRTTEPPELVEGPDDVPTLGLTYAICIDGQYPSRN